jgi:hypothetical protein
VNYSDLDHIQRADVQAFYKRYFFPANVMLAVYGDFSPDDMKRQLAQAFGAWTVRQPQVPPFPPVGARNVTGVYVAEKSDVTQTFFEIGSLGGQLRDPDFPALSVAADILGGGFSSRLVKEVRTRLGYAYDIGASWNADYDHPGLFRIAGSTQSKDTEATIAAVKAEVEKLRTTEVSEAELKTAKDSVLNSFVFFFDRPSKTLNRLLTYEYFGYPRDFIFSYQKGVAEVTRQDVLRVAQRYFDPARFTIVAVGNSKEFGTPLSALGLPVHTIDLTIPSDQPPPPKADAGARKQGLALLKRMQEALGGADRLAGIKDTSFEAQVQLETGGPPMAVTQRNTFVAPSSLRQDLDAPFGKQSVYSDGKSGWMMTPQGSGALNAAVLEQVRGEIFRQLYLLALSDRDRDRTVTASAANSLDISAPGGQHVRVDLDPASGLPVQLHYQGEGMRGPSEIDETLEDWRDVHGVKAPFHMIIQQNGKKFANVAIKQITINSGITQEELSKKP